MCCNDPALEDRASGALACSGASIALKLVSSRLAKIMSDPSDTATKMDLEFLCMTATMSLTETTGSPSLSSAGQKIILAIVWEFIDNPVAKGALEMTSLEDFANVLKAAIVYEIEYGHVSKSAEGL
jgi:hypothetical protein